jgi:hypothetical protein
VSAWIEIELAQVSEVSLNVALLVSAWIEITAADFQSFALFVALLASAWIEIVGLAGMYVYLLILCE